MKIDPARLRQIRIGAGLVLFFYVLTHFLNHAVGLISFDWMELVGVGFRAFWRFLPITIVLYGALLIHLVLVFYALYERRSIKLPAREWLQILLGMAVPLLMVVHVSATRALNEIYGVQDSYSFVLYSIWIAKPSQALLAAMGLLAAWTHGCLGLYFWLRQRHWFQPLQGYALTLAILIPMAALAGFMAGAREVAILAQDQAWMVQLREGLNWPGQVATEAVDRWGWWARWGFASTIALLIIARIARLVFERGRGSIRVTYPGGTKISIPPGASILDASRMGNIPHASVCGGRGRCSTCRVRVTRCDGALPEMSDGESKVLARVGAADGIRLACQLKPEADIVIVPLLPPDSTMVEASNVAGTGAGSERVITVLFADLRGFTQMTEDKLPYDVVFLINQYDRVMGEAIEKAGGMVDKFIGDGIMALFGVRSGAKEGSRQALEAAKLMSEALVELNKTMVNDLDEPLRMGIGLHTGPAVVGRMGYGSARTLTAIGDTVNTASRIESSTKEVGVELAISHTVLELGEIEIEGLTEREIQLRGKSQKLKLYTLEKGRELQI